jgi:hypothetical protein
MAENITHDIERGEDSQRHLDQNREKFETDAMFLLKQMLRGERLTAQTVVKKYSCEPRRLRDLHNEGKCKKEWVSVDGKRKYVEYYCDIPKPPTKGQVVAMFTQTELFPNPINTI